MFLIIHKIIWLYIIGIMLYDFKSHPCCLHTDMRSWSVAFPVLSGKQPPGGSSLRMSWGNLMIPSLHSFPLENLMGKQKKRQKQKQANNNQTVQTSAKWEPFKVNTLWSKNVPQDMHPIWTTAFVPSTTWEKEIHRSLTALWEHGTECFTQSSAYKDVLNKLAKQRVQWISVREA